MSNSNHQIGRRNFIKKGVTGFAGLTIAQSVLGSNVLSKNLEDKKIITRNLGKTGIVLPVVSMGVMNADNPNLVRAALDAGIVHLDTAHGYQRGRNESMIGGVIKNRPRDSFVISTKIPGERGDKGSGLFSEDASEESFIEKFETSLERLGLDYVDILYLHAVSKREAVLFEVYMNAMRKLKEQGKTRLIGVSTHRNEPEVIQAVIDSNLYDVVLTAYNFRQPHVAEVKKAIEKAADKGIGVVAMKTQAGGFWDEEEQQKINMKAALKWVLSDKNVHTTIPGFSTFDQLYEDVEVMKDITISEQDKKDLKLGEDVGLNGYFCPQCGECTAQCKENLDIPTLMRSYMYAFGYHNYLEAKSAVESLEVNELPCDKCGVCTVNCVNGFDVRGRLSKVINIKNVADEFLV